MSKDSFDVAKLAKEKGNEAFESKDYGIARILYSQAMKIDPSQYIYPLNCAIASLKLERWHDAEANATAALKLAPDNLQALFRRGLARVELRQWSLARQDIQAYLDGGGYSAEGSAVLDAIANFEISSMPNPVSDESDDMSKTFGDFPFEGLAIRNSQVDRKGVFASRDFKKGETILLERPLLTTRIGRFKDQPANVEAALRKMSPENAARFLSLHNAHTGGCCADQLPHRAFEIFRSNITVLPGLDGTLVICFYISQFNHSCEPNTRHEFDKATGELRVYATQFIHGGEEIFRMYSYGDSEEMHHAPRAWRQGELHRLFHFTCACALCMSPDTEVQASDTRRVRIGELLNRINNNAPMDESLLPQLIEGMRMSREERVLNYASIIFMEHAAAVCKRHSDLASVQYWVEALHQMIVQLEMGYEGRKAVDKFRESLPSFQLTSLPQVGAGPQKDFGKYRLD